MARLPRLSIPGCPQHIIQRGNNRQVTFFSDQDYAVYLDRLKEYSQKYQVNVHAYVLMTNHVHLLVTPAEKDSASLMMKHLGQRFAQHINKCYRRTGTLWEGRFKSCITQEEYYVLTCYRYIELNLVKAGMALHPQDYRWSSYSTNASGKSNSCIRPR